MSITLSAVSALMMAITPSPALDTQVYESDLIKYAYACSAPSKAQQDFTAEEQAYLNRTATYAQNLVAQIESRYEIKGYSDTLALMMDEEGTAAYGQKLLEQRDDKLAESSKAKSLAATCNDVLKMAYNRVELNHNPTDAFILLDSNSVAVQQRPAVWPKSLYKMAPRGEFSFEITASENGKIESCRFDENNTSVSETDLKPFAKRICSQYKRGAISSVVSEYPVTAKVTFILPPNYEGAPKYTKSKVLSMGSFRDK